VSDALGLIVGSGLELLGLKVLARSPGKTPYGEPSSAILSVEIGGRRVACLARHGEGHRIPPHAINYRANLWLLHQHGVRQCLAVNAVGAISENLLPGQLAAPDQLIDYTWGRAQTFHDGAANGVVHIDFTEPFEPMLRGRLAACISVHGLGCGRGVYGVMQGPRLETAAEIDRLERDGCTMVGMTAMPEAALARELGLAYALCAVAVNRAAGRSHGDADIHRDLAAHLDAGMQRVKRLLSELLPTLSEPSA
jgi:5'-methylthioinosine phosphorylase